MFYHLKQLVENFSPSILFSSKEEEIARLEELYHLKLVDTPPEEEFDRITSLVSSIFQVPIALISFLTEDRQYFKSCIGFPEPETSREEAVCQYVIANKQTMIVEDFLTDSRFTHNRLVKQYKIRFYAGAPLITKSGNFIGTLCIIDLKPRRFSEVEMQQLQQFANIIMTHIENKQKLDLHHELENKLMEVNKHYNRIVNHVNDVVFQLDEKGNWVFLSQAWEKILGFPVKEALGSNIFTYIHPAEQDVSVKYLVAFLQGKSESECNYVTRFFDNEGNIKWIRIHASTLTNEKGESSGATGTLSDITNFIQLDLERQKDLNLARKVQLSVVSNPIHEEKIQIDCEYLASKALSGDMYYWEKVSSNQYGIILFDVMGHGVASSLITMTIRTLLGRLIKKDRDPITVYEKLNAFMLHLFDGTNGITSYFTAIYLLIDVEKKQIKYVNAGHPYGLMISDNKQRTELTKGGLPIGILANHPVESGMLHYKNNTSLLLYTDGLTDILNTDNDKAYLFSCMESYKDSKLPLATFVKESCDLPEKLPDDLCVISIELKA